MNKYKILLELEQLKNSFLIDFICAFSGLDFETSKQNWEQIKNKITIYATEKDEVSRIETLKINNVEYALIRKLEHIIFYRGGFVSALSMLKSFKRGVKAVGASKGRNENQDYDWSYKDGNEKWSHKGNLPKCHFRWDYNTRYTLTREQINKIESVIRGL